MDWLKRHAANIFLVLALLVGLSLLVYPSFADYWNSFTQSRAIVSYAESVAVMDTELYEAIWNDAIAYNQALTESGILWIPTEEQQEEYARQLNINDTGNMGYIQIPKINVSLPLYHGTDEAVLQTSIGHITGTSLPVGGTGSHCVLSGHRGLPSAKLFSDLDKLTEGDKFILTVLDQTLTYQVDQIRIVEPADLSELVIDPDMDYCTLVTCTPYGINTHRMLVRGHRVENEQVTELRFTADALTIDPMYVAPMIALPVVLLLVIWVMLFTSRRNREKRRKAAQREKAQKSGKRPEPTKKAHKKANNKDSKKTGKSSKNGKKPAGKQAKQLSKAKKKAPARKPAAKKPRRMDDAWERPATLPRRVATTSATRQGSTRLILDDDDRSILNK